MKSAGYDPDRPWDKEEALFAEAKRDMDRIQAEDRGIIFDENGEMVGEADEGSQIGDDTMLDAIDEAGEGEGEGEEIEGDGEGADEEQAGDDVEEAEGEGADGIQTGEGEGEDGRNEQGDGQGGNNEDLFLPGGASP